jgi:hypothetical protein
MKNDLFRRLVPHLIAVGIFLLIAVIYGSPALQGEVVAQHDVTQWKGSIHESEQYKEVNGRYPLWTNALFSGMPTYQIGGVGNNYIGSIFHQILTLSLPKPIQFFFLACICFYILCMVVRARWIVGVLGALAFAYATYNPVIIAVGHDTKMWSIAYMPAVLGSFILLYEGRYWMGAAMATLFLSAMVTMNHLQIVYYTVLVIGIMTIFYLVRWIRRAEFVHLGKVAGLGLFAVAVGVLCNAQILFSTYDYQKATIRGGASELTDTTNVVKAKDGLDRDYAFSYSMGIPEPLVLIAPKMYGGSNDNIEIAEDKSKAIESLRSLPQEAQQFFYQNFSFLLGQTEEDELYARTYWGGIGGTSGPPYIGAAVFFLAILSFFVLDNRHKWWALTAIILSVFMSWGEYFLEFNNFLYNYLPFYNKFRAPSMIMVIPQLLIPFLAVMGVDRLISIDDRKIGLDALKRSAMVAGGFVLILFMIYFSSDFISAGNKEFLQQVASQNQPQLTELVNSFMDGLKDDRSSMMMGSIIRSLLYMAIAAGLVFLMIRRTLKPIVAVGALALLVFIDLIAIDVNYLSMDDFREVEENDIAFQRTAADEQILADRSVYRVLNVGGDRYSENITSYHYHSVGGYHPAKLRIYQDLIERQLSKQNEGVLDMLNTKYLLQKDEKGRTSNFAPRQTAAGPAWFVQNVQFAKTADEEMAALDSIKPKQTAFVRDHYRSQVTIPSSADSAGKITIVKYDNEEITYTSESASGGFAVFSEVFYDRGWKAFIDDKEVPIVRTNYVLRGLTVPAGKHNIRFAFEPVSYKTGTTIGVVANILTLLIILWAAWEYYRKRNRTVVKNG